MDMNDRERRVDVSLKNELNGEEFMSGKDITMTW